jgi:hypothetical protein
MQPLPARLFLLALLAIDWAADPYQGAAPLVSTVLSSTEVFCHSLVHAREIARPPLPAPCPCAADALTRAVLLWPGPSAATPTVAFACRDPLYAFMSIQR